MARLPRLYAPGIAQHIVQRPVDGRTLFVDGDDYALFVALLEEGVRTHAIALHAYVLLPGEVRLLATPGHADSIARLMQAIGRRYVPHINRKTARRGALWDRRYRSTLLDADAFLLAAMRFIEHRPVDASLVGAPEAWRWSSHAHHVGHAQQPFLSDHGRYWALSDTPFARQAAYRAFTQEQVADELVSRLDGAVEYGWVLGDQAFIDRVRDTVNRRPEPLSRGRKPLRRNPKRPVPI